MAKRIQDLPDHHRFTGSYKPKTLHIALGICPCGCKEEITTEYEYSRWEDQYFVDREHFIKYMMREHDYSEVG